MSSRPDSLASVTDRQAAIVRRSPGWTPQTLDGALDRAAADFAERPFFIGETATYSYADMAAWSARLAAGLQRAGIKPGDHVALLLANYPEFAALKFALSRIGAVCVPLNILNRRDELAYMIEQSDSVALITMARFRDLDYLTMLDELAPGWESGCGGARFPKLRAIMLFDPDGDGRTGAMTVAMLDDGSSVAGFSKARPGDTADIIYTSGTTGAPKGVLLTHDMLLRTAFTSAFARAFEDGRRILFALPMYHVFGYVEGLLSVGFVGGAVAPMLKFDGPSMLDRAVAVDATDLLAVPTMTLDLIDAQRQSPRPLRIRSILSSGARAPDRVWDEIETVLGIGETTTGYGMTEVTASSTVTRPDDPLIRRRSTNGRLRDSGPAGDPALGGRLVAYRVVDPLTGETLPRGSVGELRARGSGVTSGYYEKPDETTAAFDDDGWLRTGDLGSFDTDDYLILAGRLKESYRCGGEQVMPTEIEDLLTRHAAVVEAHVVPVPDERMGEVGAAFVLVAPGRAVEAGELRQICEANLARFKVPRHFLFFDPDEIPKTGSGRARKFLLTEIAKQRLKLQ